jgi:hypothetical protein
VLITWHVTTGHVTNLAESTRRDSRKCADLRAPIRDTPVHAIDTPLFAGQIDGDPIRGVRGVRGKTGETGLDERGIADLLGLKALSMARLCSRLANLADKNRETMAALEKESAKAKQRLSNHLRAREGASGGWCGGVFRSVKRFAPPPLTCRCLAFPGAAHELEDRQSLR